MKKERLLEIIDELTEMQSNTDVDITELFRAVERESIYEAWTRAAEVANFFRLKKENGPRRLIVECGVVKILCEEDLCQSVINIIGLKPIIIDDLMVFKFIEI